MTVCMSNFLFDFALSHLCILWQKCQKSATYYLNGALSQFHQHFKHIFLAKVLVHIFFELIPFLGVRKLTEKLLSKSATHVTPG